MSHEAMKPYGIALLDYYYNGDNDAGILYERDDGFIEQGPVSFFFRKPSDFSPTRQLARLLPINNKEENPCEKGKRPFQSRL
jgi:hypothetical protein